MTSRFPLKTITVIDTSFGTWNLGDEIIMQAVNDVIHEIFPDARVFRLPSHEALSRRSYYFLRQSDLCLIGGTNVLASKGWRLRWRDSIFLKNAICFGVTWGGISPKPAFRDRVLLRRVLDGGQIHSVRDRYTKDLLDQIGVASVSTSCPTMWMLTPEHCAAVPFVKAKNVLFTLTAYRCDPTADRAMIDILRKHYETLHFFPQMHGDYAYFQDLNIPGVRVIGPNLRSYDEFLANEDVDYVGSRLHGGIRALQFKKRTLVIGIDHRSAEIANDTGLPVLRRTEMKELEVWVNGNVPTRINLPTDNITNWKANLRLR
ncbi:MAG: polysaccharide pyruvyl transferase family protein [Candidatus Sulfotelmatobacter sp.]